MRNSFCRKLHLENDSLLCVLWLSGSALRPWGSVRCILVYCTARFPFIPHMIMLQRSYQIPSFAIIIRSLFYMTCLNSNVSLLEFNANLGVAHGRHLAPLCAGGKTPETLCNNKHEHRQWWRRSAEEYPGFRAHTYFGKDIDRGQKTPNLPLLQKNQIRRISIQASLKCERITADKPVEF